MSFKASFGTAFSPIDSAWITLLIGEIAGFNELLMVQIWRFLCRISAENFRSEPKFGTKKPKFGFAEIRPKSDFFYKFDDFLNEKSSFKMLIKRALRRRWNSCFHRLIALTLSYRSVKTRFQTSHFWAFYGLFSICSYFWKIREISKKRT